MAIAIVQSTSKVVTGVNNTTLAYTSNLAAGNLLVVSQGHFINAVNVISTPVDTLTHTFTGVTAEQSIGTNNKLRSFYAENSSAGADTVTFDIGTAAGNGDITCVVSEWSGALTSGSLDKTNTGTNTGTAVSAGATGTLTQADEMIWAAVAHSGNNTTITEDTGDSFTMLQENEGGTSNFPIGTQYKIVSATTDTTPDFTLGASRTWIAHVGTFKAAAAAAQDTPELRGSPGLRQRRQMHQLLAQ